MSNNLCTQVKLAPLWISNASSRIYWEWLVICPLPLLSFVRTDVTCFWLLDLWNWENSQSPLNYPKQTVPLELYYKSFSSQTRGSRISYTTQLSNSNTKCQSIPCLPLRQACMGRLSMYRSIFPIDRTWTDFETLNLRVWILLVTCLPSPVKILVEAERESWKERRAIVTV